MYQERSLVLPTGPELNDIAVASRDADPARLQPISDYADPQPTRTIRLWLKAGIT